MKVLTIGGAMVDTVAIIDDALIERMSMSNTGKSFLLLEQGSKTEAECISTHCGGGALNSAVSFRRLGHDVATLIKIGEDQRGEAILDLLEVEGISSRYVVVTPDAPTGASTVISAHERNAAVFTFRGANSQLRPGELTPETFARDIIYCAPLSGDSADLLPAIAKFSHANGAKLIVNPGIRQIERRFDLLLHLLPKIDVLVVNRVEGAALLSTAVDALTRSTDVEKHRHAATIMRFAGQAKRSDAHGAANAIASGILALGATHVLLTDGRYGAYFATSNETIFEAAENAIVVGTAGAGDAFASTFAAMLFSGKAGDAGEALRAAAVNAGSVVSYADAQTGLLKLEELSKRLTTQSGGKGAAERWTTPA